MRLERIVFGILVIAGASLVEGLALAHVRVRSPLCFEANLGQAGQEVRFVSRADAYRILITDSGATLLFGGTVLRMRFVGTHVNPDVQGLEPLESKSNYLVGNDPAKWQTSIPHFARIRVANIYEGTDLVYYGRERQLEYDFVVHPHANPGAIRLELQSSEPVSLNASGDIVLDLQGRHIQFHRPIAYQELNGARSEVTCWYVLRPANQVAVRLGPYDASRALVIDPVLSYSTYLGGNDLDAGNAIAVDASGAAYITGSTASSNFPTTKDSAQPNFRGASCFASSSTQRPCSDVFVTKINHDGKLVYSTYLGGSADDAGQGIAVDSAGNAYVTGFTFSTDFPLLNAFQSSPAGRPAAFVAKLNPHGSALVYSTFLSGSAATQGNAIAVNTSGNAYITGWTEATDFPTLKPLQAERRGTLLFRSTDNGNAWAPSVAGLMGSIIYAVVADPNSDIFMTVYAGGDAGVFKSVDGGVTWTAINSGLTDLSVRALAIDPFNSSTLYAGTTGSGIGPGDIFKTTDGGATWRSVGATLADSFGRYVVALLVDPSNSSTLYAGTRRGVFKSTDAGATWKVTGLSASGPDPKTFVEGLILDPKSPTLIYAATEGGVMKSVDGAQSWHSSSTGISGDHWVMSLAIDPVTTSTLYAATRQAVSVYKSIDGGATWNPSIAGLPSPVGFALMVSPSAPSKVFLGAGQGAFASDNGGTSWRPLALPIGGVYYSFGAVPGSQTIFASFQAPSPADAFVTKLSSNGSALVYSTYLGGSGLDQGLGIAVDAQCKAYITGVTDSPDFPTANALQTANAGSPDAFVTVVNADGTAMLYSTYLGGSGEDRARGIAVDPSGAAYVTGTTLSTDFPTLNAFQDQYSGSSYTASPFLLGSGMSGDVFVTKLNPSGSALVYSTYLGGSAGEEGAGIAVDGAGQAYIAGLTASKDFPTRNAVQDLFAGGIFPTDAFVAKLDTTGSMLLYSTYLGGRGDEEAQGIALNSGGSAYITGTTSSPDFPMSHSMQLGSNQDAFVTILNGGAAVVNGASFQTGSLAPGSVASIFGEDLAIGTQPASATPLPTVLLTTTVTFNGIAAPLYYVSPGQVNVQVPFELPLGIAQVQLTRGGAAVLAQPVRIADVAPGIVILGGGTAAVVHASDFRLVSKTAPAHPGEIVAIFCTGLGRVVAPVTSGNVPPTPAPATSSSPIVMIGGQAARVLWSGLAPGFVGLYQVNTEIPPDTPSGDVSLELVAESVSSNSISIAIR